MPVLDKSEGHGAVQRATKNAMRVLSQPTTGTLQQWDDSADHAGTPGVSGARDRLIFTGERHAGRSGDGAAFSVLAAFPVSSYTSVMARPLELPELLTVRLPAGTKADLAKQAAPKNGNAATEVRRIIAEALVKRDPEWPMAEATRLVARWEHGDEAHRQWLRNVAIPDIAEALAREKPHD